MDLTTVDILDTEPDWLKRGVKEGNYIKVYHPSLNRVRGCYKLPGIWMNILCSRAFKTGVATPLVLPSQPALVAMTSFSDQGPNQD